MASYRYAAIPSRHVGELAIAHAASLLAFLALALLCPSIAPAQDSARVALPAPDTAGPSSSGRLGTLDAVPPITVGARLRVRHHSLLALFATEGTVVALRGDTVDLRTRGLRRIRPIALAERQRVELHLGRASRARGAALGGIAGAVGSLLLAAELVHGFGGSVFGRDAATVAEAGRLLLPYGVGKGALIGAVLPGDRWQRVRLRRASERR